jgi:hypothetical protein
MKIALMMNDRGRPVLDYFAPFLAPEGWQNWQGHEFTLNPEAGVYDGVVCLQAVQPLDRPYSLHCPPTRSLLIVKEPPDILFLPVNYTRQFHAVLAQDPRIICAKKIHDEPAHTWFAEVPRNDEAFSIQPKTRTLSAIVSAKTDTRGHRIRLEFMRRLKNHFGERLDWFGRGIQDLGARKDDGLASYKYHIVLENGCWPGYWTEKLADAYVTNCHPFYWGCPNVHRFFPAESLTRIDIQDPAGSIAKIESAIAAETWEKRLPLTKAARELVWNKYHPFETIVRILSRLPKTPPRELTFLPHDSHSYSFRDRALNRYWRWRNKAKLVI